MKTLLFALLALGCVVPLHADEALQNGNFSDGINHWHGDGRSPADFASDNSLQASDPFTSAGLIVPLKHVSWSMVAQDFRGNIASGILTVTFKVSPDLVFSNKPDDYTNIPAQLSWGWKSFNTPPGEWLVFISAQGDTKGKYYTIMTKAGSSDPQTVRFKVKALTPLDEQTITLAFPPGNGTIVILGVSIDDH